MRVLLSLAILLLSASGTLHSQRVATGADDTARWERIWAEKRATEARNHARLAEARWRFLAGHEDRAGEKLKECEYVPHGFYCMGAAVWDEVQFFSWDLDGHRFDRALERFHALVARYDNLRDTLAARMARVYMDAGISPPAELGLPDLSANAPR